MRVKAIYKAIYYGLMPWWIYEKKCHHEGMTYLAHLWLNIQYAFRWLTFRELESDIEFEKIINQQS